MDAIRDVLLASCEGLPGLTGLAKDGELMKRPGELALDVGLLADDGLKGTRIGKAAAGHRARVVPFSAVPALGIGDLAVFDAEGAAEAPGAGGDGLDEQFFGGADGRKVGDEGIEEPGELVRGLAGGNEAGGAEGTQRVPGAQAVLEGVTGRTGLALGRAGAGGFLGVLAVGGDLFVGVLVPPGE